MNSIIIKFLMIRFFSALGDQLLLFAVPLLIYQTTHSIALSGLAFFIEWLPRLISLPFAGILTDRFGGKKIYLLADGVRALASLSGFGLIAFFPSFTFFILSTLTGICAFSYAQAFIAQEATIPALTSHANLHKAQSLVQTVEQSTMIFGPLLASLLAYFIPIKHLLLFVSLTFSISFVGMHFLKNFSQPITSPIKNHLWHDVKIAGNIILTHKKLRGLCTLTVLVNLIWGLALATGAAIVTGLFSKTPSDFGLLQTIAGILSMIALISTPFIVKKISLSLIGYLSYTLIVAGGILISYGNTYSIFMTGYLFILTMDGVFNIYIRTERAKIIPKEHLGKTIGFIVLINQLSIPFAGLIVANFSETIGVSSLYFSVSVMASLFLLWQLYLSLKSVIPNPAPTRGI